MSNDVEKRVIAVEVDLSMAERVAQEHRDAGWSTRIYPRSVQAAGLTLAVFIVVLEGRRLP